MRGKAEKYTEKENITLHFPVHIPGRKRRILIIQVDREYGEALVKASQTKKKVRTNAGNIGTN